MLVVAYLVVGAALLPFAAEAGPDLPGFNALFAGGVFVIEGVTAFLLMVLYRRQPQRSVVLLVGAYLFSRCHEPGLPAGLSGRRRLGPSLMEHAAIHRLDLQQLVVELGACWTFAAVLKVEVLQGHRRAPDRQARRLATLVPALATVAALAMSGLAIMVGDRLPLLGAGGTWTSLNAIFNHRRGTPAGGRRCPDPACSSRPPRDLFLWLSLALAGHRHRQRALHIVGGGRYTVGWYACRLSWPGSPSGVLSCLYFSRQVRCAPGRRACSRVATGDLEERTPRSATASGACRKTF